jgi:hypothetical protein
MVYRLLFIFSFLFLVSYSSIAQVKPPNQDSLRYSAFETYSQKKKVTRFLHKLIFKPLKPKTSDIDKKKAKASKSYRKVEGKVVRTIHVSTFDPFGYYVQDTTLKPESFYLKAANSLHIKTQAGIIKNLLLFKENETFDSLLVRESERLVRSQKYLRDVRFYTVATAANSDSVDVIIYTYDVWSIIPELNISPSFVETGITDNNFAGLGHQFHADRKWKLNDTPNTTRLGYYVPNISNSYISSNVRYIFTGKSDSLKSIELKRTFHTPLTKWAGGVFLGQMKTAQNYIHNDTIYQLHSRVNEQDYWGARSWQVLKKYSADAPVSNYILSARILRLSYPQQHPDALAANLFNNQTGFFAGIGFTSRKYIRDKLIFDFGKVEDVPVGQAFGLTFGMDVQKTRRLYFGAKAAVGNYYPFGYLSAHLEYGSYVGANSFQQGALTSRINYFTKLITIGNWKIRQFVKPTVIVGLNRLATDNLTFNEDMEGFEKLAYSATSMMVLTLQTQSYSPWNLIGFRFGPYIFSSFGMLGNGTSGFSHSRLYTVLGLGVLIKNDYLMFSTFQLSMSFYPYIPGDGYNIFKTNSFQTSDYGFRDFEISKPGIVVYR